MMQDTLKWKTIKELAWWFLKMASNQWQKKEN